MAPVEIEVLQAVYALLNVTSVTTNSGLDPSTGSTRAVTVYNMVPENVPVPYVRLWITDTTPIDAEHMEYGTAVRAKTVRFMADVYSDYHPEMLSISYAVQVLMENVELTTAHYHGSTWVTSVTNLIENVTNPDRIYQHAAIRVEARMQSA